MIMTIVIIINVLMTLYSLSPTYPALRLIIMPGKFAFNALLSTLAFSLFAPASTAHTPYLAPATFEPIRGGIVTLDASFAEKFFIPEVVIDNTEFYVVDPSGKRKAPDTQHNLISRVALEHKLEQEGTYRFSTGLRSGRIFRVYELNGERKASMDANEKIPTEANMLEHFRSITKAETFVTLGAPNDTALSASGDGLEIHLRSHPNDLFVDDTLALSLLFEGKALAETKIDIYSAEYQFSQGKPMQTLTTNKKGSAQFTPTKHGVYLLRSRHRAPAPKGAEVPVYSFTYSLVIEVLK